MINIPTWQLVAELQHHVDHSTSIDESIARSEALDVVIGEVTSGATMNAEAARKRFHSLRRNRLQKHKNRRMLQSTACRSSHRRGGSDTAGVSVKLPARTIVDVLAYKQMIELLRTVVSGDELDMLMQIGDGRAYADIAADVDISVPSLKAKVFRLREKVRNSRIAPTLRNGLRR